MAKASPASKNVALASSVQLAVFMAVKSRGGRLPKSGQPKIKQHFLHLARKFFTGRHPTRPLCQDSGMRGMEVAGAFAVNSSRAAKMREFGFHTKFRRDSLKKAKQM